MSAQCPVSTKADDRTRSVQTTASASVLLMSTFIGPTQTSDLREGSNREFEKSKRGVPPSDLLGGSIVYTTGAASLPARSLGARMAASTRCPSLILRWFIYSNVTSESGEEYGHLRVCAGLYQGPGPR